MTVRMGATYGEKEVRIWIMGFGLVLILIGLALMASWSHLAVAKPVTKAPAPRMKTNQPIRR